MPLIGNDPRIEAWERELIYWEVWCARDAKGVAWFAEIRLFGKGTRDIRVGPFPRFQDVIDAALEKERAK